MKTFLFLRKSFDTNLESDDGAVLFPLSARGRHSPPQTENIIQKKHVGRTGRRNVLPDVKPRLQVSMHWRASAVCPWLCAPPRLPAAVAAWTGSLSRGCGLQAQQA